MRLQIVGSLWHVSGLGKPDKHWRHFFADAANTAPEVLVSLQMGKLDTELPGMHQMGEAAWITLPDGGILVRYQAGTNRLNRWRGHFAKFRKKHIMASISLNTDKPRFSASLRGNASWSVFEVRYLPWRVGGRDIFGMVSEFIFSNRSVDQDGLMLHASAVLTLFGGIVFTGPSETGKTTQARLWELHRGAKILNGDRPLLQRQAGDGSRNLVNVCGLPWSGSEQLSINGQAPLRAIFILEQALENQVIPITAKDALPLLLPRMFLPYYRPVRMEKALRLVESITGAVPVFRLLCTRDEGAVGVVEACLMELDTGKSTKPDGDS